MGCNWCGSISGYPHKPWEFVFDIFGTIFAGSDLFPPLPYTPIWTSVCTVPISLYPGECDVHPSPTTADASRFWLTSSQCFTLLGGSRLSLVVAKDLNMTHSSLDVQRIDDLVLICCKENAVVWESICSILSRLACIFDVLSFPLTWRLYRAYLYLMR